jgi:hypothetical protein
MLSQVRTAALWGLEAFPVECEVDEEGEVRAVVTKLE